MYQIRHRCGARLLDSKYICHVLVGPLPDISIKCGRCSRADKKEVVVGYRLALPHSVPPILPEPIYCTDINCMARICDMSLPYMLVESSEDLSFACPRCKEITKVRIGGVVDVR